MLTNNFTALNLMFFFVVLLCILNVEGCNRSASQAKKQEQDSTPDLRNESQFLSVSVMGPESIVVVTLRGDLFQISGKNSQRKLHLEGPAALAGFLDSAHGWVVDRKSQVWNTSDGDSSWKLTFTPSERSGGFYQPQQLILLDELHGWLIGLFQVWSTNDGGKNWQERFSVSKATDQRAGRLYRGVFVSQNSGWLASSGGVIMNTSDGGATWKTLTPVTERTDLHDVFFINERIGWIVGRPYGGIYSTENGGVKWTKVFGSDRTYLNSVDFVDRDEGWAAGWRAIGEQDQERTAVLLHTLDGGHEWAEISTDVKERYFDKVLFNDKLHGWLVARDSIYYTDNSGQTFQRVFKPPPIENSSK